MIAAGGGGGTVETNFPIALEDYNDPEGGGIGSILASRIAESPFSLVGSLVFLLAICHTFAAAPLTEKRTTSNATTKNCQGREVGNSLRTVHLSKRSCSFIGEVEAILEFG